MFSMIRQVQIQPTSMELSACLWKLWMTVFVAGSPGQPRGGPWRAWLSLRGPPGRAGSGPTKTYIYDAVKQFVLEMTLIPERRYITP